MVACCACIHPMVAANGKRICRADPSSREISPGVEKNCRWFVRKDVGGHEMPFNQAFNQDHVGASSKKGRRSARKI